MSIYDNLLKGSGALFKRRVEGEGEEVAGGILDGWLGIIDNLSKENVLHWKDVEELSVVQVFNKLIIEREKYILQKTEIEKKKFAK